MKVETLYTEGSLIGPIGQILCVYQCNKKVVFKLMLQVKTYYIMWANKIYLDQLLNPLLIKHLNHRILKAQRQVMIQLGMV